MNGINDIQTTLIKKGYIISNKISNTLQGSIFVGTKLGTNKKVAIKIASIKLHSNGITLDGQNEIIKIKENIVKEMKIIRYLQTKKPPKGFLKYIDFFNDDKNYYFIMDYGGEPFWEYIMKNIKLIKQNKLDINKWKIHVKKLFKQMCLYINWLHNNNVCHLDISLENCLIKNNIIYFCDFGLSEYFTDNNSFKCRKYVGKSNYIPPEIYYKTKSFDACKADSWSLGVVLFMMLTGTPLYKTPSFNDPYFINLKNGFLKDMVISWDLHENMNNDAYNLLNNIFKPQKYRYNIKQILNHKFLANVHVYS